jgi:hypothetical protein
MTTITLDGLGTIEITPARRNGLAVLVEWGSARTSNRTASGTGVIYWQTADWLRRRRLVTRSMGPGGELIELTDLGRQAAAELGLDQQKATG